ncbi:MAG: SprB repeat-containing protein [Flavobacterium sp.]|nr:SprB repeat-containing protein [Flavobacterium sp.]
MTLDVASVPRWTMDLLNGKVAVPYFTNAGIPATAYSLTRTPQQLSYCDDIFVMPHAYPQWTTHSNLYDWNLNYHGAIWLSCTAGSELEDMFNPANHSQQTNFLSEKDPSVVFPTGTVTTIENALTLYSNHTNGGPPYTYSNAGDPFMQFMGSIDSSVQNGLEQVYLPKSSGWRASTTIGVYDPDHTQRYASSNDPKYRAAIVAYGRGFGDSNRGYVMIEASHSLSNATLPDNIAAQRIFFNFSFMSGKNSTIIPNITGIPTAIPSGVPSTVSFAFPVGTNPNNYTVTWSSACGGTFTTNTNDITTAIFTPPSLTTATSCPITVSIADACGRIFNTSQTSVITTEMQITTSLTNSCFASSNGTIFMAISGAAGPYTWTWTNSTLSTTGSGSGTLLTNLAPGVYSIVVTSGGGSTKTISVIISENPVLNALSLTTTNVSCNGQATGSISVDNVSGGTAPYTFLWSDAATTQNRSTLIAGSYTVTAKDINNCEVSATATVTQPSAILINPTISNVSCYGNSTGAIAISATGGSGTLSYLWNDGATTQNRTNIAGGTYSVTITDASNCSKISTGIVVTQPTATLSPTATQTNVACYGNANGAITVTPAGGTSPYSYSWGGGVTTQNRANLIAGTYTVTITDTNGCTSTLTKTISQPSTLTLSTVINKASCPGVSDGEISLTISGGTTNYTVAWTGPSSFTATTTSLTGIAAGSYTVTVTDANGCTATATVVVGNTNPSPVTPGTITK